jgi:hypothetical protein
MTSFVIGRNVRENLREEIFPSLWDLQGLSRLLKVVSRVGSQGSKFESQSFTAKRRKRSTSTSNRSLATSPKQNPTRYLERGDVLTMTRWGWCMTSDNA